jgi:hypothetical protein
MNYREGNMGIKITLVTHPRKMGINYLTVQ